MSFHDISNLALTLTPTIADAPLERQNIVDITKYGDKYYIAVMSPRPTADTTRICIYESNTGELIDESNWTGTAVFSAEYTFRNGHDIKIITGIDEILVYYSSHDTRGNHLQNCGIGCISSPDGISWTQHAYPLSGMSANTPALGFDGPDDGFANSIDVLKDEDANSIILAAGSYKDFEFSNVDVEYSHYGTMGSGSVLIFSASLDASQTFYFLEKLTNESSQDLSQGETVIKSSAGLYGASVSLNKKQNQYQVYVSLPAAWNEYQEIPNKYYWETLWYHYSYDCKNWSQNIPVVVASKEFPKDSYIGFGGIKAIEYNNKTYVIYSEPGRDLGIGSGFVTFTNEDGTWDPYAEQNKIKLIDGLSNNGQYTSFSNLRNGQIYRTFSVDALATEQRIYYAFGSPRAKNLSGSLHFGFSEDGIQFQQDGEIELEFGNKTNPLLGTSVALISTSSANNEVAACVYSDIFNINSKTIGKSITFELDIESEKARKAFKHAAIEPFFAPGIFYNTIKSGISVDWPSISGSTSYVPLITESGSIPRNPFQPESIIMSSVEVPEGIFNMRGNLRSRLNYRIPFENIMNPDEVFASKEMLTNNLIETYSTNTELTDLEVTKFLDKTYIYGAYEPFINPLDINEIYTKQARKFAVPFVYKNSKSSKNNSLFSMAMNNCLAEIPNFFLEQEKISILQSEPDYNWLPLTSGSTYYVDVILEKSEDLVMMESWHSEKHPVGPNGEKMNGRYFGYPVNKTNNQLLVSGSFFTEEEAALIHNDPAYAPYTPPYFEGTAVARISFTPKESRKYQLDEIFAGLQIQDIFADASLGWSSGSDAEIHKMKIGSSVEIFDSTLASTLEVGSSGEFNDKDNTVVKQEKDSKVWIIRPRIETPVLNFADQSGVALNRRYSIAGGFGKGMWSGYGQIPNEGEGIKLKLAYPFDSEKEDQYSFGKQRNKYPLLDYVKFKNTEVDIGKIASQKEVSEAIVLIPYVDSKEGILSHGTSKQYIEGINFIKINNSIYHKQLRNIKAGKNAVTKEDGAESELVETSISRMIKASDNYVIPPNLNFFEFDDIEPFVMYFFEFGHILSQKDLSHIWQGVMPDISYSAELDEVTIEHEFTRYDLFNGTELPPNMKWMVFKVKKKAMTDYKQMIDKSKFDPRLQVELQNGKNGHLYGYNWPYDFFSLVELAKIEIELEYEKGKTPPPIAGYTILE